MRSLFLRLSEALHGPVLAGWCALWPIALAWSSVHGHVGPALLAIVALVLTPYLVRHRFRRGWLEECARHEQCHIKVEQGVKRLGAQYGFTILETAASELERLSDKLREAPPSSFVDPHALAGEVERRAAQLRKKAPDPPPLDLREFVAQHEDS